MLGYSKAEWIFAGILGVVLFSWILWPSKPAAVLHLAPITPGAIPEKIGGCGEGCKKMDKFAQWQPLLAPLVEMHRRQKKCASVEYAMPDIDSDPLDPKFYVQCKDARSGQLYNTFYTRTQIETGKPATSESVSRAHAEPLCAYQLAEKLPGATIANQGFYEAPNGSIRLTYDLKVNGAEKKAACLVSHTSVEFNVVR